MVYLGVERTALYGFPRSHCERHTFFPPSLANSPWSCSLVLATSAGLENVTWAEVQRCRSIEQDEPRTAVQAARPPHTKPSKADNGGLVEPMREENDVQPGSRASVARVPVCDGPLDASCARPCSSLPAMLLSVQAAGAVAVLAVLSPFLLRIALSPWTFFFVGPPLLIFAVLAGFLSTVILGWVFDRRRRPRAGPSLAFAARPLVFSTPAAWQAVLTRSKWSLKAPQDLRPLRPDLPVLSANLNEMLIMIVRDFVLSWYTDLSSSPTFPAAVSETLHGSMDALMSRMASLDLASLLVRRILPKLTDHVNQFRSSETALRGAGLERHLTQSEELDLLLASRYAGKGGSLHTAVDNLSSTFTKQTEESHIRQLVDMALPYILPAKDAGSHSVHIVAREIIACAVLGSITDMLADPDFWNRTIDQLVFCL